MSYAKVKEPLAQFLYDNRIVPSRINLFYSKIKQLDNKGIESINIETEIAPVVGTTITLESCPELKFIQGINIDIIQGE